MFQSLRLAYSTAGDCRVDVQNVLMALGSGRAKEIRDTHTEAEKEALAKERW